MISPLLVSFRPMIARPIVVFPLPDSPTSEKVSPLLIKKLAFLTATNFLLPSPKEISKSLISTNFSDISFLLVSQMGKSHFFTDLIMEICNHSWFFYFWSILMKKPSFSPMCL
ncbi:Uncharacterised protein [Streptococcus pneumoniae]|nr:Uncharacterised protein [Streptococcus pneumoniae]